MLLHKSNTVCRHAEGSLLSSPVSLAELQALQQPAQAACLVFVVNSPAFGVLAGEATYDVAQLAELTSTIQAAMLKVG